MRDANGQALSYVFCVLSADLRLTSPFHACGKPTAVLRQDQSKSIRDCVGVRDCEADAGSRNIEDSASLKQATIYSNPGLIVAPAAGCSTAIIDAPASDVKCKETHAELQANPSTHDKSTASEIVFFVESELSLLALTRDETDRGEYRQAAGTVAQGLIGVSKFSADHCAPPRPRKIAARNE